MNENRYGRSQCHNCKQIKLKQFVGIKFEKMVPQFVLDFFRHMTSLDLMELMRDVFDEMSQNQKKNASSSTQAIL